MAATVLAIFRWLTSKIFRHKETGTETGAQDFALCDSGSMGKKGTRRRKKKKPSQAQAKNNPPAGQTSVHDLPDELLDHVLLGLAPSLLHLVRAAATCRRWRRAVAGGGFVARCQALHCAPRAAGHYYTRPAFEPDDHGPPARALKLVMFVPTAPAARAKERSLFSLNFIYRRITPKVGRVPAREYQWVSVTRQRSLNMEIGDSRGSLLLLQTAGARWSPDFIVCEPVSRRFQAIVCPAALGHPLFLGAFLLDGGGADAMSNYRVLNVLCQRSATYWERGTPRACVFAPGNDDGGWRMGWNTMDDDLEVRSVEKIHLAGRAAGRIYWGIETARTVLVLDESTLKFSLVTFPEHMRWQYRRTSFRVIGGVDGDSTVRVVRMDGQELAIYGQLPRTGEWVLEKSVRLREAAAGLRDWKDSLLMLPARIVTVGETFVVLSPAEEAWLFSVELETMELEREHERNWHDGPAFPCAQPWPPVLQACVDQGDSVGKGRRRRKRC
ncbi:unnamed protein product [Urochloa decumbens]|uniref:F-box domain-containing protein n=1 Tax=Urochloa decumbens TaxID=240449 RepID=A0ABC9FRL1_9POAL